MKKVYHSKIGLELIIPIAIILIIGFKNIIKEPKLAAIIFLAILIVFMIYIFTSIKYTIENQNLNIKAGFLINEDINILSIQKISKSNNILSAPAASLDRLEIIYGNKNSILISPKNKADFIDEIKKINPNFEVNI